MNIPCDRRIDCPGDDSPIRNYSAEGPDSRLFCEMGFYAGIPRIGECWERTGCAQVACSLVSSEAAELEAYNASLECAISTWSTPSCPPDPAGIPPTVPPPQEPPREPVSLYRNTAQTCTVYCDSGEPVSYTVPAGTYLSRSQLEADTDAYTEACARAQELLNQSDCMGCCDQVAEILSILQGSGTGAPVFAGSNPPSGTELSCYGGQIVAAGLRPIAYTLESGSIPTGTTLNGSTGLISGASPVAGTYTFTIRATNTLGSATQEFTIFIDGLAPSFQYPIPGVLPSEAIYGEIACSVGSDAISQNGGSGTWSGTMATFLPFGSYSGSLIGTSPIVYSLTGTLPTGVGLDSSTGAFTGMPTDPGQFLYTFIFYITGTNAYGRWILKFQMHVF